MSDPMQLWVIVYSIKDSSRYGRVHELLRYEGRAVGRGVFEIVATSRTMQRLTMEIGDILSEEDDLRLYRICAQCREKTRIFGSGKLSMPPAAIIV